MSMLLDQAPRFSNGAALLRHYAKVKRKMSMLQPPPLLALPSPTMMARGNPMPVADIPAPVEIIVQPPEPQMLPLPRALRPLSDIEFDGSIPDQTKIRVDRVLKLEPAVERLAIRLAVELYYERVQRLVGVRRGHLMRSCVATAFRMREGDITGSRRTMAVTRVRQISMALMARLLDDSTPAIGLFHGGRDHTTVLHAKAKMKSLVSDVLDEMYDGQSCALTTIFEQEVHGGR